GLQLFQQGQGGLHDLVPDPVTGEYRSLKMSHPCPVFGEPSVPIPKFARSRYQASGEFRNGRTLATFDSWCRFGFEVRIEVDIDNVANFEPTTLGHRPSRTKRLRSPDQ